MLDSSLAPLLVAAGGAAPVVEKIGLCLASAALLGVVFQRLKLPVVAALLLGGVLLGPIGLGWITEQSDIETIANLGLTLLLFVIGLELDLKSLLNSGKSLGITGALQVPLTAAAGWAVFAGLGALGVATMTGSYDALYLGFACAFSSTLLVVKALQARYQLDTLDGRMCLGLLIFQDIWAIVLLAVQPSIANPDLSVVGLTFAGIGTVALVAALAARFVLPGVFTFVARFPELLVITALGWCFGLGLFGYHLGHLVEALTGAHLELQVSLEMGALIAGTAVASLPFAHDVVTKVANLRDFFITLFFAAIGMSIPLPDSARPVILAILLALVVLVTRYLVFLPLLRLSGTHTRHAASISTKLAQASEFALVIFYLGTLLGHIDSELKSVASLTFVMLAIATPAIFDASDGLGKRIYAFAKRLGLKDAEKADDGGHEHEARIVLLGFHRIASSILHELSHRHPQCVGDVLVVDFNTTLHDRIRATGAHVAYGDLSSPDVMAHAHLAEDAVIVSTVPDDLLRGINNLQLARRLREQFPKARIIVNAMTSADVERMREAGADFVFMWRVEAALSLMPALIAGLNGALSEFAAKRDADLGPLARRLEVLD